MLNSETTNFSFDALEADVAAEFEKASGAAKIKAENADANIKDAKDVLRKILDSLDKINFREICDLDPKEKVTNKQTVVVTVNEVLRAAKEINCSLCFHAGNVHIFNGSCWIAIEQEELERFLGEAAEKFGVGRITAKYHLYREALRKQFLSVAYLPKPEVDESVCLINLRNGTFEVKSDSFRLREFRTEDFLTYQLPFDYDQKASCPKWRAFLDEVLPDKSKQNVLAQFLAYIFTSLKLEKVLLLFGTGANGKSVVFETIAALLGEHNISHFSLSSLKNDYQRAMLAGKLLNYASEISTRLEADVFKKLASGEPCEARLPYGKPFILRRYARLAFNCNELPRDVEHTTGYFRRFLILEFDQTIPAERQNPQLAKEIIETELSGVFNWILEGLQQLLKQGNFTQCEAAQELLARYRKESDSAAMFFDEMAYQPVYDSRWGTYLKVIYQSYRLFCDDYGFRPLNIQNLSNRLKALGFESKKTNKGVLVLAAKE